MSRHPRVSRHASAAAGLLFLLLIALNTAHAANNPGHDSLYVLKLGDNVTGNLNITGNLTANLVQVTTRFFGPNLDIRGDGTSSAATTRIIAGSQDLELSTSTGGIRLEKDGGVVYVGQTGTSATLNVTGTIYQDNVLICLQNGTNCPIIGGASSAGGWTNNSQNTTTSLNVGIGTTTPTENLVIKGSANSNATGALQVMNSDSSPIFYVRNDGFVNIGGGRTAAVSVSSTVLQVTNYLDSNSATIYIKNSWNSPGWKITGEGSGATLANYLILKYNDIPRVAFSSGGNVGIGTTAPTQSLDVNGSLNVSGASAKVYTPEICLSGNCRTSWPSSADGTGGWTNTSTKTTTSLLVGIGTTGPSSMLEVANITAGNSGRIDMLRIAAGNDALDNVAGIAFSTKGTHADGQRYTKSAIYHRQGNGGFGYGDLVFAIDNNGGNGDVDSNDEKMRLTKEGRLGLGIATPEALLQVGSNTTVTSVPLLKLAQQSGDPNIAFKIGASDVFTIGVDDSDGDKLKIGTTALDTNTRLTIDASGNIGFGTSGPSSLVEIANTSGGSGRIDMLRIAAGNDALDNVAGIAFSTKGTHADGQRYTKSAIYHRQGNGGFGYGDLVFAVDNDGGVSDININDEKMRLTKEGRLGLGTAAPEALLQIGTNSTSTSGTMLKIAQQSGDPNIAFKIAATDVFSIGVDDSDGDKLKIGTSAIDTNTRLVIDSQGKIGIGVTGPSTLVEIGNTTTNNAGRIDMLRIAAGNDALDNVAGIAFSTKGTHADGQRYTKSAIYHRQGNGGYGYGDLVFAIDNNGGNADLTTADEVMRLTSAGRLGIGTSNPGNTLEVAGTINATSIKVGTTNVCLQDGTNCPAGTGTVNSGSANKIAYYAGAGTAISSLAGSNNGAIYYDGSGNVQSGTLPVASGGTGTTTSTGTGSVTLNNSPVITSPAIVGTGSITASSGAFTTLTRNGQNVCTADGTNCPTTSYQSAAAGWTNTSTTTSTYLDVGIGTASPGSMLTVRKSDAATVSTTDVLQLEHNSSGTTSNGFGTGILIRSQNSSGTMTDFGAIRTYQWGANTYMEFYVKPSSSPSISKAMSLNTGGLTVGDGTVNGGITVSGAAFGWLANSAGAFYISNDGNNIMRLAARGTSDIVFATTSNDTERMRILNSGNVGINVTSPSDALTVGGTINVTNIQLAANCNDGQILKWSGGVGTCGTDSNSGGAMSSFTVNGSSGSTQTINDGNNLFLEAGSGITTTAAATDKVTIAVANGGIGATQLANSISLGSGQTLAYASGTINANQFNGQNGRYYLNITGINASNITSGTLTAARGGTGLTGCSDTQVLKWVAGNGWTCGTDANSGGSGTVNSGVANKIAYYTGAGTTVDDLAGANNGALYYDGSGNVQSGTLPVASGGTGTTTSTGTGSVVLSANPTLTGTLTAATITASGAVTGASGGSGDAFVIGNDAKLTDINYANQVGIYGVQDSTTGTIRLGSGGNTITGANGNIGIGTTNPLRSLHINGTGWPEIFIESNYTAANNGRIWGFATDNGNGKLYIRALNASLTSSVVAMTMQPDGNIGIGTTSPGDAMELAQYTAATGPFLRLNSALADGSAYMTGMKFSINGGSGSGTEIGYIKVKEHSTDHYGLEFGTYGQTSSLLQTRMTILGNGNIGIAKTNPTSVLDVTGNISASGNIYAAGSQVCTAANGLCTNGSSSAGGWTNTTTQTTTTLKVGIGTTSPNNQLAVHGNNSALLIGDIDGTITNAATGIQFSDSGYKHIGLRYQGGQLIVEDSSMSNLPGTWYNPATANFIVRNGSVGINTLAPTQQLEVSGNINVSGTGNIYYAGNLTGYGADLAEFISGVGVTAGDVVILSESLDRTVEKSTTKYDTRVAGIISTRPSHTMGAGEGNVTLALAGRVPVKVTAEGGPIRRGDLLTTSSTPGHAMRCEERQLCSGAIVGKAMEPFNDDTGMITALVVLG